MKQWHRSSGGRGGRVGYKRNAIRRSPRRYNRHRRLDVRRRRFGFARAAIANAIQRATAGLSAARCTSGTIWIAKEVDSMPFPVPETIGRADRAATVLAPGNWRCASVIAASRMPPRARDRACDAQGRRCGLCRGVRQSGRSVADRGVHADRRVSVTMRNTGTATWIAPKATCSWRRRSRRTTTTGASRTTRTACTAATACCCRTTSRRAKTSRSRSSSSRCRAGSPPRRRSGSGCCRRPRHVRRGDTRRRRRRFDGRRNSCRNRCRTPHPRARTISVERHVQEHDATSSGDPPTVMRSVRRAGRRTRHGALTIGSRCRRRRARRDRDVRVRRRRSRPSSATTTSSGK